MQWSFHDFIDQVGDKTIHIALINSADCSTGFSFDGHLSASKFLV